MSISSKNHSASNFQCPAQLFFCHHQISFKNLIISAGGTRQALTSKSDFEPKFAQCSVRCTMVECTTQEFWYQIMRCLLLHFSRRLTSRGIKSTNQIDLVEWSRDGHKEEKRLSIFDNCRAQVPYFSVEKLHKIGPKFGAVFGGTYNVVIRISYFKEIP